MADTTDGRVDIPQFEFTGGPVVQSSLDIYYTNGSTEDIAMNMWVDDSTISREVVFPPTGSWTSSGRKQLTEGDLGRQVSFTTKGDLGVRVGKVSRTWGLNCSSSGCFYSTPREGLCPEEPLPGIAATEPSAPDLFVTRSPNVTSGVAPFEITFDASRTEDRNFDPISYFWDFSDGTTATDEVVTHTYDSGIFWVQVTATDTGGLSDREIYQLRVTGDNPNNNSPVAVITPSRTNVLLSDPVVTFDAYQSTDADGDALDFVWADYSNKVVHKGPEFSINFSEPDTSPGVGVYLGASDGAGGLGQDYVAIFSKEYPGSSCEVSYIDDYPEAVVRVTLYNNTNNPVLNWQQTWSFNSSVELISSSDFVEVTGSNPYIVSGTGDQATIPAHSWVYYSFRISSDDLLQNLGITPPADWDCLENIPAPTNHKPILNMSHQPISGDNPLTVQFSANGSYDPDGDALTYRWKFGDGSIAYGENVSHTYTSADTNTVNGYNFRGELSVSDGSLTSKTTFGVEVTGDPGVHCSSSVSRILSTDDFTLYISVKNNRTTAANGISGVITLSAPVSVTSTENVSVNINGLVDTIPFTINRPVSANSPVSPSPVIRGKFTDPDFYQVDCTADSF